MYKNGGVRDLLCPIKDLYERKNGRSKVFEMVPTYLGSKECYLLSSSLMKSRNLWKNWLIIKMPEYSLSSKIVLYVQGALHYWWSSFSTP